METINKTADFTAFELQVKYQKRNAAREKITSSVDAFNYLRTLYSTDEIESLVTTSYQRAEFPGASWTPKLYLDWRWDVKPPE
jgi:hypothetical protein